MDKSTPKKKAVSVKKVAPKKTAKKKTTVKKTSVKKASRKKSVRSKKSSKTITYQQRYQMIAEAAYLIAEKQGFKLDNQVDNWLQAESEIDDWIKSEKILLCE